MGQTRFTWPDTTVTFARYTSVEQCNAALERVWHGLAVRRTIESGVWWDTMPYSRVGADTEFTWPNAGGPNGGVPAVWLSPVTRPVYQAAAQRCGERFSLDSIPVRVDSTLGWKQLPPAFARFFRGYEPFNGYCQLFSDGGANAKFLAYLDRRLQHIESQDELAQTLASTLFCLRYLTPPDRHRLYDEVLTKDAPRLRDRVLRARFYGTLLLDDAHAVRDTVTALGAARRLAKFITDSLTPQERDSFFSTKGGFPQPTLQTTVPNNSKVFLTPTGNTHPWSEPTLENWLRHYTDLSFNRDDGIGALRKSTDAYIAFAASKLLGFGSLDSAKSYVVAATGIGRKAPPLKALAWAGPPVNGPRPTPGRVSLVVLGGGGSPILDNGEQIRDNGAGGLVLLRRLVDSFPELEVTVATIAKSYFGSVADSLTVVKQAELTYQWYAAMGLKNVSVAIMDPGFRRLPEPDGRPVTRYDADSNGMAYARRPDPKLLKPVIGAGQAAFGGEYLIDQDGLIVYEEGRWDRAAWPDLAAYVRALIARKRAPR